MCGINGIALSSRSHRTLDAGQLERMRDVLTHRGPDEAGVFVDGNVGLGHRRLSIVDVAAGQQPMTIEDGRLHITYNGEIYNHADFRPVLESLGHRYITHCDTETILHLYEEYGPGCVEHLRGMFAFAIWDSRKRELFIARDRLGVKPVYYVHSDDGSLYFASEIKALLEVRAVRAELNFNTLPEYLAYHAPSGEETLFRGVRRLAPGHTLLWRDGQITIHKYWDIRFVSNDEDHNRRSEADCIEEWRELFRESVRLRLMADVPLGMFLSGGIDSSAIAAMMSGMVSEPIKTFSVAFTEREANELEYARLVARTFHTQHYETVVTPEQFWNALPDMVWYEDEPLGHVASIPLHFVSRLAERHVKVVLTGEGSDELLAGYERYRKTILNVALASCYESLTSGGLRRSLRHGIESLPVQSKIRRKLERTFLCVASDIESIHFDNFAVFPRRMQDKLLTPLAKEQAGSSGPFGNVRACLAQTDADTLLNRLLYVDMKTYLHELLMKQDQMSMSASIESRVPFLDHKLVEFTARLPERLKLRGWTTKYILRQSMKGLLPDAILKRPKMGFPVPVGSWLRGAFRWVIEDYVLSERALGRGLFDRESVTHLVAEHQSGTRDHQQRLWALINLEIWQRRFIDNEPAARPKAESPELMSIGN